VNSCGYLVTGCLSAGVDGTNPGHRTSALKYGRRDRSGILLPEEGGGGGLDRDRRLGDAHGQHPKVQEALARFALALVKRIPRAHFGYTFDAGLPPALEVNPGEQFWVETNDAHRGTVTDQHAVYSTLEDAVARLGGTNPIAGPVAVAGACPGDCLVIRIEEIVPAPRTGLGYTCTTSRVDPGLAAESILCRIDGDAVVLPTVAGPVRLPLAPMIGTLGIAPTGGVRPSFRQGRDILGNVDIPQLATGATVILRAQVLGGMVFLGDAHLAQGDAEIHRAAVEAEADVRLRVDVTSADRAGFVDLPQVNDAFSLGSAAPGPGTLDELVRLAYADLAQRLEQFHGLVLSDAYRLLGAVGRVTVCQLVPPLASVLAAISRRFVPNGSDLVQ
jgi:amidase